MKTIFLCEDTPEGIFTAVYDTWLVKGDFSLRAWKEHELELFTEYKEIQTDQEKAIKVARSVKQKLGQSVYGMIFAASLSYEADKADAIYAFLKLGFRKGTAVKEMHGLDEVCRIFELKRNVLNEAHYNKEFLRFQETKENILIARIHPKNQTLPLIAEHFCDRFPEENFVVLDATHDMALFHEKGREWYLAMPGREALEQIWAHRTDSDYEKLWKTFFKTISIKERENYKCQRTHCALRYRGDMTEFG